MKKSLLLLYMLAISVPIVFRYAYRFPVLTGIKSSMPSPHPHIASIISGEYQDSVSRYEDERNGLRYPLTRTNNEVNYWLWRKGSSDIMICKDRYLITEMYINAYLGIEADSNNINQGLQKLDSLYTLLGNHNIQLLWVIAPGKASFNSEKIPDHYYRNKAPYNNYDIIKRHLGSHSFPSIDFNAYFASLKATSKYELFPKQGTHWSVYGASLAIDSIAARAGYLLHIKMPKIESLEYVHTVKPQQNSSDADLQDCLNLLYPEHIDTLTYRYVKFPAMSDTIKKPRILFIGDSYASTFNSTYMIPQYFDKWSKYWYYMDDQWDLSGDYLPSIKLSNMNLEDEILKYDVVILLSTEINYWRMDWGLYDRIKNMDARSKHQDLGQRTN